MASTGKYTGKDGKEAFWVRWREPGGKQPRAKVGDDGKPFRSVTAARKYGEKQEVLARQRGPVKMVDRQGQVTLTVAQYAWHWFDSRFKTSDGTERRDRTPGARRWNEGMIRNHIDGSSIADRRLTELTKTEVERWIAERSVFSGGTLANTTLKMAVGLLRSIYDDAVSDNLVDSSPVPGNKRIQWPRDGERAVHELAYVPLSVDQVHSLADAFPRRYRAMPLVQAGLGLRIGELLGLRDVDIHDEPCDTWGEGGAHVHVEWQFNDTEKKRGFGPGGRARPKSRHSRRGIPLPQEVAEVLREHMAEFPPGPDGSVFTTTTHPRRPHAHGGPPSHQYYGQQMFKDAMRKAGLPDCSTHDLRHHYATELLDAGVKHETVAKYLGHADAGLVISTYGHAKPGTSEDVRAAISSAWQKAADKRKRHLRAV